MLLDSSELKNLRGRMKKRISIKISLNPGKARVQA
jgi:hypothetical protein